LRLVKILIRKKERKEKKVNDEDELDRKKIIMLLECFDNISNEERLDHIFPAIIYFLIKMANPVLNQNISVEQYAEDVKKAIICAHKELYEQGANEENK
jgi:hypothetical protein